MGASGRRVLGGRYELQGLIATGGMGQVWRARDTLLGRTVAVKVLRSEYSDDPTFLARFRAEAQHTAALSHPNIAAVHDYGEDDDCSGDGEPCAYLVMELVEGEPLSAVLHREGALEPERTLSVLRQTAAALAVAHASGVVHRDVKPGNILVTPGGQVKITDFGISWSAASVPLTQTGQVVGTAHYLSPEQARGEHATPASDVYALGMVGYECLTGHKAFDGENSVTIALKQLGQDPEPLPGELPPGVRTLVRRALLKDPRRRFADGAQFAAAVDDVLAGRPLPGPAEDAEQARLADAAGPATRVSARSHRAPPPRHHRSRIATVVVPLLALLVGAGVAVAAVEAFSADSKGTPAVAASTQDDATFVLHPEQFLGRPVDEVTAQLTALGLNVRRQQEVTREVAAGTVTGIDPAGGAVARGDTVVVRWAAPPPIPGVSGDDRRVTEAVTEDARATTPPAPRTTTEPPVETTAPTTATSTTSAAAAESTPTEGAVGSPSDSSSSSSPSRAPRSSGATSSARDRNTGSAGVSPTQSTASATQSTASATASASTAASTRTSNLARTSSRSPTGDAGTPRGPGSRG